MSVLRRLLSETVIYSITPLLSALVGFVLVPIYTRTFSPSDYGALAQVNTTTTLATIFVVFGLDNSSAVWFWEHPESKERARTFSTWLAFTTAAAFVIAIAAAALRAPLARVLLKDESLAILWLLFAVNVVVLNVSRIGILWFRMNRSPWPAVLLGGLAAVGTAVFGIGFVVHLRFGLTGVIAGQAAGSWIAAIATLILLRRVISVRAIDAARLSPMLRLSAPLVLMTNLNWVMGSSVTYFVNFLCSREDAGLYQVANSLVSILGLLVFAFDQAWAPFALSIRDATVARRVYGVAVEAALVLGLLLAYAAATFAQPALLTVTHPRYVAAQWVLALLALNVILINVPTILSVTFAREKVTMPLAKATAAGAAVTVIILPLAAKVLGKEGAALAVLMGSTTVLAVAWRASQRVFPIDIVRGRVMSAVLITGVWAAGFLLLRPLVATIGGMLVQRSLLVLSLAVALALLYRAPLSAARAAARQAEHRL